MIQKIFYTLIFLTLIPSISNAHLYHYKEIKKIEMEIFRNNKLIGFNNYYFNFDKDTMIVTNKIKFNVKFLGKTIFRVEGSAEEKYLNGKLISFNSKTLQNKKRKFVDLEYDKNKKKYIINGSSFKGEAEINNIIGNWWNHKILQANAQISPISGSIKKQIVSFQGNKNITLYDKTYNVDHFKLISKNQNLSENKKLNFDIWYNKKNGIILKVSYLRMGKWEYRVKNIEQKN